MRSICTNGTRVLVAIVCQLLVLQPVFGQQVNGQRGLRIVVVEGAGARNVVQQIAARPLLVRVHDADNQPIAGAIVEFNAPDNGPSAVFENDSRTMIVTTDNDGLASAGTLHPNGISGSYSIRVRAEFEGQRAVAAIQQSNVEQGRGRGKMIAILGIVAAAVGAAIAVRSGGGDGPDEPEATPSTPTITFGGAAVGAPKG